MSESVYRRDASFHNYPGRGGSHGAFAHHWLTTPTGTSTAPECMARCNPRFTMLDIDLPLDPANTPEWARCGRPGCRQQWAAWAAANA